MTPSKTRDMTTDHLDRILQNVTQEGQESYIRRYTQDSYSTFSEYFNDFVNRKGLEISDIICKSNISRNYIYNIVNGSRNPGRDKIIALCIGAGMNVSEINRGLKIAGLGVLYAKNERDARMIIAVNNGVKNVIDINIALEKAGLEILE